VQEHEIDLVAALNINAPLFKEPSDRKIVGTKWRGIRATAREPGRGVVGASLAIVRNRRLNRHWEAMGNTPYPPASV